jgi:hypothetical protein
VVDGDSIANDAVFSDAKAAGVSKFEAALLDVVANGIGFHRVSQQVRRTAFHWLQEVEDSGIIVVRSVDTRGDGPHRHQVGREGG